MATLKQRLMLPQDKANHYMWGTVIGFLSILALLQFGHPVGWAPTGITIFIAALVEVWDKYTDKGTPDIRDFAITVLGGLLVNTTFQILHLTAK